MESISTKIKRFYSSIENYEEGAPNTRYKSWEWCHKAFMDEKEKFWETKDNTEKERIVDNLALHLAFYLASWGMYRGSSFLLQRDYKAHKKAVECILEEKYEKLWDYEPEKGNIEDATKLIFGDNWKNKKEWDKSKTGVYNEIKQSYGIGEKREKGDTPTDTLITKILMGTYGCVPAYDRFLKSGIAAYTGCLDKSEKAKKLTQSINPTTFQVLAQLVIDKRNSLNIINSNVVAYPPMKCIDMFFWEIGFEIDIAKGLIDDNNDVDKKDVDKKDALLMRAVNLNLCRKERYKTHDYKGASDDIKAKNTKKKA